MDWGSNDLVTGVNNLARLRDEVAATGPSILPGFKIKLDNFLEDMWQSVNGLDEPQRR